MNKKYNKLPKTIEAMNQYLTEASKATVGEELSAYIRNLENWIVEMKGGEITSSAFDRLRAMYGIVLSSGTPAPVPAGCTK